MGPPTCTSTVNGILVRIRIPVPGQGHNPLALLTFGAANMVPLGPLLQLAAATLLLAADVDEPPPLPKRNFPLAPPAVAETLPFETLPFDDDDSWREYTRRAHGRHLVDLHGIHDPAEQLRARVRRVMAREDAPRRRGLQSAVTAPDSDLRVPRYRIADRPDGVEWSSGLLSRSADHLSTPWLSQPVAGSTGGSPGCSDSLAMNLGSASACSYSCTTLINEFYADKPAEKIRCFVHGAAGWPLDLMERKQTKLDWHEYLQPTNLRFAASFDVGNEPDGGRLQRKTEPPTCQDLTVRVETHRVADDGQAVELTLGGGGQVSGPATFSTGAAPGLEEITRCFFDGEFTLTKPSWSGGGWEGTVSVWSVTDDNTIYVDGDESWIVHGTVGSDGLPVTLDARFETGSYRGSVSHANLVFRYVRFTGQMAPLDADYPWRTVSQRTFSDEPVGRWGGVLQYNGGHGAKIVFDHCVADHNFATSGGVFAVDGRYYLDSARPAQGEVGGHPDGGRGGLEIRITNSTFWANVAVWAGGVMRLNNAWPIRIIVEDSQFFDNGAYIGVVVNGLLYCNIRGDNLMYGADSKFHMIRTIISHSHSSHHTGLIINGFGVNACMDAREDAFMDILHQDVLVEDVHFQFHGLWFSNQQSLHSGTFNVTTDNLVVNRVIGEDPTHEYLAIIMFWVDSVTLKHTHVAHSGTMAENQGTSAAFGTVWLYVSTLAQISYCTFVENMAASGGALAIKGPGRAEISHSVFEGNRAFHTGGALTYRAEGALQMVSIVFNRNAVLRTDAPVQDITVRLFSGAGGFPSDGREYASPVWYIGPADDDLLAAGGVYHRDNGTLISPQHGMDVEIQGVDQYYPFHLYTEVVSLPEGRYRLWHGVRLGTQQVMPIWEGDGWIDIPDVVPRVYPRFSDNRNAPGVTQNPRDPSNGFQREKGGCNQGSKNSGHVVCPCAVGTLPTCRFDGLSYLWSHTDFSVRTGQGGALAIMTTGSAMITDCVFSSNSAGVGAQIWTASVPSVAVQNTSFAAVDERAEMGNNVVLEGGRLESCTTLPCAPGYSCQLFDSSRFCTRCAVNEVGDGDRCYVCAPGTEPNEAATECVPCSPGQASMIGICNPCDHGSYAADTGQTICLPCVEGTRSTNDNTGCLCDVGTYNSTAGRTISCIPYEVEDYSWNEPNANTAVCTSLSASGTCLELNDQGGPAVSAGWSSPQLPESFLVDGISPILFRCPHPEACLAGGRCHTKHGYTGVLCAVCATGYTQISGHQCEPCTATDSALPLLVVIASVLLMVKLWIDVGKAKAVVISSEAQRADSANEDADGDHARTNPVSNATANSSEATPESTEYSPITICGSTTVYLLFHSVLQPGRIIVGYLQIVTHLGIVLDTEFPGYTKRLFDAMAVLVVDVESILQVRCVVSVSFYAAWVIRVLVLPALCVGFVLVRFAIAKESARLNEELFLVLFLLFPGICNRTFALFVCRNLGRFSVLVTAFEEDCYTSEHFTYQAVAGLVVVLFCLGTPGGLVFMIVNNKKKYQVSVVDKFVATRVAAELECNEKEAASAICDVATASQYSFLINAFHSHLNYWEGVDLLRKLFLVGLLVVAGRGTTLQLYIAVFVAMLSLSLQVYFEPYKHPSDNLLKLATEIQIFASVTTAIAVFGVNARDGSASTAQQDNVITIYDTALLSSVLAVLVMFIVAVHAKWRLLSSALFSVQKGAEAEAEADLLSQERRAFLLLQLGLASRDDMELLRSYFDRLESVVQLQYDVFISYRVQSDAPLARRLFDALSSVEKPSEDCSGDKRRLRIYLDQARLIDGQRWDKGFLEGLSNSLVVMPIVSTGALRSMLGASETVVDNVLLEWLMTLELHERGAVKAVLPLLVGENAESDFFASATAAFQGIDSLPTIEPKAVLSKAADMLQDLTEDSSLHGAQKVVQQNSMSVECHVRGIVAAICLFQGVKTHRDADDLKEILERATEATRHANWNQRAADVRKSLHTYSGQTDSL
eukprot:COSAG02_NODE_230_length_28060_cov_5.226816_8_plen_1993_part_00